MFEYLPPSDLKKKRIKLGNQDIQPQDVLFDRLSRSKKVGKMNRERGKEVPIPEKSFYYLMICSLLLFSILFLRSFQLQIVDGEYYSIMARRNQFSYMAIGADRGVIYDRNMNQLIFNNPKFLLVLNKSKSDDWQKEIIELSKVMGVNYEYLIEKAQKSRSNRVVILNDISQEKLIPLEVRTRSLSSLYIERIIYRDYSRARSFSQAIGFIGMVSPEDLTLMDSDYISNEFIGRSGLERFYESYLRVTPGSLRVAVDVKGRAQSEEVVSIAKPGNNLVLWSDIELQDKIYEELARITEEVGSVNAAAIAVDPRTGGVLAMVSYPGFDANVFSGDPNPKEIEAIFNNPAKPLFNRTISGLYTVGSLIKPLIGLAALEEEVVTPEKEFYSDGEISIPNPWDPLNPAIFRDWIAHGWVDMRRAIAVSSNIFFYKIGGGYRDQRGLGPHLMKHYLSLFGWNNRTGIDLYGEEEGFIPSPKWKLETLNDQWRVGDSYNLSIGQGYMLTTPIQATMAFVAIANRGELLRPMLVEKILDNNGNVISKNKKKIIKRKMVSDYNLNVVREGMRDAVLKGSATLLNQLSVTSAAKTGTAQIPKKGHYNNWVTVFAPYDDPEIVITIVIEEVEGVRAATVPVAKNVLKWYFKELR